MKKTTLYNIPVNKDLIWDYKWKEEDYKTEKFLKWYLSRLLSYGTAKDLFGIDFKIIDKYIDEITGVPKKIREFWIWFLRK